MEGVPPLNSPSILSPRSRASRLNPTFTGSTEAWQGAVLSAAISGKNPPLATDTEDSFTSASEAAGGPPALAAPPRTTAYGRFFNPITEDASSNFLDALSAKFSGSFFGSELKKQSADRQYQLGAHIAEFKSFYKEWATTAEGKKWLDDPNRDSLAVHPALVAYARRMGFKLDKTAGGFEKFVRAALNTENPQRLMMQAQERLYWAEQFERFRVEYLAACLRSIQESIKLASSS